MRYVRETTRPLLLFACAALFAVSGCPMPPIAFHDGLPAWTPGPGKPEGSIGYHRMYWSEGERPLWYLTPGFRFGLAQPPGAADIGLTSVVVEGGGEFAAVLGPTLGIGYQQRDFSVVVRPSAYVLVIGVGDVQFADEPFWQVALLAGNGTRAGETHVSGGGRVSRYGVGPVLLVGHSYGPVDLRLEGSYMFPHSEAEGRLLTVGLTIGGPAPEREDESGPGDSH